MVYEGRYHRIPLRISFGPGNIGSIPESENILRVLRHFLRHEAQFDERTNTQIQKTIVNLIDVGEVIDSVTLGVDRIKTDLVVKYSMKTHILEIGRDFDQSDVPSVTVAQCQDRTAGAEHLLPEMRKRRPRPARVHFEGGRLHLGLRLRNHRDGTSHDQ